jgi:hypothetical protein
MKHMDEAEHALLGVMTFGNELGLGTGSWHHSFYSPSKTPPDHGLGWADRQPAWYGHMGQMNRRLILAHQDFWDSRF